MSMRNSRRATVLVIVAVVLAAASTVVAVLLRRPGEAPAEPAPVEREETVTITTFFVDETRREAFEVELLVFQELFPQWTPQHIATPYRETVDLLQAAAEAEMPDVVTIINPELYDGSLFHETPVPWGGNLWGLYYHEPTIVEALGEVPQRPADLDELLALFVSVAEAGLRPLAIGASHGWPLTSLVQHLAAAMYGEPAVAREIAAERLPVDGPEIAEVLALLRTWRERGWIADNAAELAWPAGPSEVAGGDAAFTLLNDQVTTPIPAERRGEIGYLDFPGTWAIGSIYYLARPASQENRRSTSELMRFLLSAGTVDRLERAMKLPFFGGVRDTDLPESLIPSVTSTTNSPYHHALWQAAAEAIR